MDKKSETQNIINASDDAYRSSVFEALMYYQAIEEFLRECILMSYEIINAKSHQVVKFKPEKRQIENVKKKMGLGGLALTFKKLTHHTDLCDRIIKESKTRNHVAHAAAVKYLQFPISENGARNCQDASNELVEAFTIASWLYEELLDVRNEIFEIHGQVV